MADIFTQFGGQELPDTEPVKPAPRKQDPFAQFGGQTAEPSEAPPPDDTSATATPAEPDPFAQFGGNSNTIEAVDKEIQDRSFLDKPAFGAEFTRPEEIEAIAKKHGVDPARLRELAPYFGARFESDSFIDKDELKRTAGMYGQAFGLGAPQKLYKTAQEPNMERALDDIQNLASGRSSYLQLGGEVAVPLGPLVKGAKASTRIAKGVGVGAAAGAAAAKQGQELQGAALGAGLGGALTGTGELAGHLVGKFAKPEEAQAVARKLDQSPEIYNETTALLERRAEANKILDRAVLTNAEVTPAEKQLVDQAYGSVRDARGQTVPAETHFDDLVQTRISTLAEDLTGNRPASTEEARKAITDSYRTGTERIAQRLDELTQRDTAREVIQQRGILLDSNDSAMSKFLDKLSDAQFVVRDIDRRFNPHISAEETLSNLNKQLNKSTYVRDKFRKELNTTFKQAGKADEAMQSGELYDLYKAGKKLDGAEAHVMQKVEKFYDDLFEFSTGTGQDTAAFGFDRANKYLPDKLVDREELISKFERKMSRTLDDARKLTGKPVRDLAQLSNLEYVQLKQTSKDLQDIESFISIMRPGSIDSRRTTPAELSREAKAMFRTRDGVLKLDAEAKAAMERSGSIPNWAREKNIYKLMDKSITDVVKSRFTRREIDQLRDISDIVERAGGTSEAQYLRTLITDLQGVRKGTFAEYTTQAIGKFKTTIDKMVEASGGPKTTRGAMLNSIRAVPEILMNSMRNIYPNLLGLSGRALLMNSTQGLTKVAPELGGLYGYTGLLRGAVNASLNPRRAAQKTAEWGLKPAEYNAGYRQAISEGIRRSTPYAMTGNIKNGMDKAAMRVFEWGEQLNRNLVIGTAETMAADLVRGSSGAMSALAKLPPFVQRKVKKAGNNQEAIAKTLANYLNDTTMYNYNRASMSEFGRTMGPLFSTFSKWPTATLGDIRSEIQKSGVTGATSRLLEKYIAAYVMLKTVDHLIYGADSENMTDRQKLLLTKNGLSQAAPINTLTGFITGDFFTPPAVDTFWQGFLVPVIKGEEDKLARSAGQAVQNFVPGMGWARALLIDLPTYVTGSAPEGSTFQEKLEDGSRFYTK